MRNSKSEALASLGKLEKLGHEHVKTGKTILKLAVALRRVTDEVSVQAEVMEGRKAPLRPKKGHSKKAVAAPKGRKLSAAAKKKISDKMKARWAERKVAA